MIKLFPLVLLLILIGCDKEDDDPITPPPGNETYYDCTGFFLKGDYTAFCTVNTPLANIIDSTIDGGGTICTYLIPALNSALEVNSAVRLSSLETSAQALQGFENTRIYSDTTAAADSLRFHTDVVIDGYDGYIAEGNFANYSKSIVVRYNNVIVSVSTVYYPPWFSVEPCNYSTSELTALMSDVLENM